MERGEGFTVTRCGRPVAKLVPYGADKTADRAWSAAYQRMITRLEEGVSLGGLRAARDELYGR